ncbi:hypothetical protein EVAR_79837_1 [Eumeta japonica]|uniref:Uncharacterized protein n=1 Tax=Eumeta variegata TaxID=151549 RepID=A0A4C1TZ79_EUMVA|nr:hypothetical protein EVAR_79837_1 [Eumeta japonica]
MIGFQGLVMQSEIRHRNEYPSCFMLVVYGDTTSIFTMYTSRMVSRSSGSPTLSPSSLHYRIHPSIIPPSQQPAPLTTDTQFLPERPATEITRPLAPRRALGGGRRHIQFYLIKAVMGGTRRARAHRYNDTAF